MSRGWVIKDYYVPEIESLRLSLGFRQFAKSCVLFLSNFKLKYLIPWLNSKKLSVYFYAILKCSLSHWKKSKYFLAALHQTQHLFLHLNS